MMNSGWCIPIRIVFIALCSMGEMFDARGARRTGRRLSPARHAARRTGEPSSEHACMQTSTSLHGHSHHTMNSGMVHPIHHVRMVGRGQMLEECATRRRLCLSARHVPSRSCERSSLCASCMHPPHYQWQRNRECIRRAGAAACGGDRGEELCIRLRHRKPRNSAANAKCPGARYRRKAARGGGRGSEARARLPRRSIPSHHPMATRIEGMDLQGCWQSMVGRGLPQI